MKTSCAWQDPPKAEELSYANRTSQRASLESDESCLPSSYLSACSSCVGDPGEM